MDENNEIVASTNDTEESTEQETVEAPVLDIIEDSSEETPAIDVDALQATNKKLYERAKKAEAELKALRPQVSQPKPVSTASSNSVEETVLLANGMPEELLGELKAVAKARGINSLIKAQTDSIFIAVKEKFEKDQKSKDASLGASRGSGNVKARKTFNTPGLTREEHMKMVKDNS